MKMKKSNEDYLKSIFMLQQRQMRFVKISTLASRLNVSPAIISDKIKKLREDGYLRYAKYKGIQLTTKGILASKNIVRRHRILKMFLHEVLGLIWKDANEEAERLEYAASQLIVIP